MLGLILGSAWSMSKAHSAEWGPIALSTHSAEIPVALVFLNEMCYAQTQKGLAKYNQ